MKKTNQTNQTNQINSKNKIGENREKTSLSSLQQRPYYEYIPPLAMIYSKINNYHKLKEEDVLFIKTLDEYEKVRIIQRFNECTQILVDYINSIS